MSRRGWLDIPASIAEGNPQLETLIRLLNESMRGVGGGGTGNVVNNFSSTSTVINGGGLGPRYNIPYAATVTVSKANGSNQWLTLTGDASLDDPVGFADGDELYLRIRADATGNRTLTPATPARWELPAGWTIYLASNRVMALNYVFDAAGVARLKAAPIEF